MADAPGNRPGRTADPTLDAAVRERLLAMLKDELTRASDEALARGASPDQIAAQLDERIARLRAQIAAMPADDKPSET
jgi:uncharacterized small protein (DUF1192 family)